MSLFPGQPPDPVNDDKGATFNADRTHRYRCWRTWDADLPPLAWLMLNPSTADERVLDPTLKRVRAFSIAWGFGGFEVWNLWSLRSTDPKGLWTWLRDADSKEATANSAAIWKQLPRFRQAVCAWGAFSGCSCGAQRGAARETARAALAMIHGFEVETVCLGQTLDGHPRHPLYIHSDQCRIPYPDTRPTAPSEP